MALEEVKFIPRSTKTLEVGCALGNGFRAAKDLDIGTYVGIESNPTLAKIFSENFQYEMVQEELPNLD